MQTRNKILLVDDSEINRSLLSDMLSNEYDILEASNGLEAISCINRYHAELSLILLDIVMPKMDGFEVLAAMHRQGWIETIPVIIISAETASTYIEHAYDLGAAEYINRPFDEKAVKRRVSNMIMLYSKQKLLENMLTNQMLEKEKSNLIMVEVLSHIVEFRNGESGLHVLHIRVMTEILLKQLIKITDKYPLTPTQISLIANASAMHDIGKISIPEHILNKPGKLTSEEYEIMKTHSALGAQMLESVSYYQSEELVKVAHDICRWHHERYDGRGYPDGLRGEEIPIAAQAVALADVYDALTNERIYKPAFSHEKALEMILNGECGMFNPLLLQCLTIAAPYLKREMAMKSPGRVSRNEIHNAARNLMQSGNASNRTLALLEQERTKYQFFASLTNEIQFEYDYRSDLLTLSDWAADLMGVDTVITAPRTSKHLQQVFAPEDYDNLREKIQSTTLESPVFSTIYQLNVRGAKRWYKVVARPLWIGDPPEMTGVIGKFIDIHDERLEMDHLKKMAHHDPLTGLYNREYARRLITKCLQESDAKEKAYLFMLFDVDFFKSANDQYGHLFGDKVLGDVAQKIRASTRESDIVARIGGDEFLLFLECKKDIPQLVDRVFNSVNSRFQQFDINASMGISIFAKDGTGYDELFQHADQALYTAKQRGRKQYCFYDSSMKNLLSAISMPDDNDDMR